ncbi:MAG: sodium:solute symporter family transporter [Opitutaceae bacterium]
MSERFALTSLDVIIVASETLDVYRRFWRANAGDAELIAAGRIAAAAALVLAGLTAPLLRHTGLFTYFQTGVTYMATPFISVILLGMFWRRTSYAGAIVGLIGGLFIQIALAVVLWASGAQLHWLYVGAIAQAATMLLIVVVSLRTRPPAPEQSEPFHWRPSWLKLRDSSPASRSVVAAGQGLVCGIHPRLVLRILAILVIHVQP